VLAAIGVRNTGSVNLGGSIATAGGVVFIGATNDSRFRALIQRTASCFGKIKLGERAHHPDYLYGLRPTVTWP
jgi:quinoprotein glucose dehydrogenase